MRVFIQLLAAFALAGVAGQAVAAVDPDQSKLAAPAGDGWQVLSLASMAAAPTGSSTSKSSTVPPATLAVAPHPASVSLTEAAPLNVVQVVVPGTPATPTATLTFSVTPHDVNLRNALDRWLQVQGWQLAWKIDDDLPLEFNATFTGDFTSVLTQTMAATNHMRTPTRICRHTNNVIRVIARAANCKD
ncbi:toxin co-regulated pilus biosynthesis Q family protein [Paraburkholderia gardini]|uniref:toxin co-regulated pilus biosynthesis Q family protein n=1 Tax=Paraburkholderia gardini TaxID=2823469 RepID=UPI001E3263E7|nr:toxin co-regulated pilus biosynthesis Q family protein [Paraburkholderia gardini]